MTEYRVGIGVDAHAFGDGIPLVLGGVAYRPPTRARRPFPTVRSSPCAHRRAPGRAGSGTSARSFLGRRALPRRRLAGLLADAYARTCGCRFELVNADCVLIGEEPRMPRRARPRCSARLAEELVSPGQTLTVRATTTDGLGSPVAARASRRRPWRRSPACRDSSRRERERDARRPRRRQRPRLHLDEAVARAPRRPRRRAPISGAPVPQRAAACVRGAGGTSLRTVLAAVRARTSVLGTGNPARADIRHSAGHGRCRPLRRGSSGRARTRGRARGDCARARAVRSRPPAAPAG